MSRTKVLAVVTAALVLASGSVYAANAAQGQHKQGKGMNGEPVMGKAFHMFADFKNMTPEQMKAKILEDTTKRLANEVKDGKITQEQSDKQLVDLKAKLDKWDGKTPFGGQMNGKRPMMGGRGPGIDGKRPMIGGRGPGMGMFGLKPEDMKDLTPDQAKAKIVDTATQQFAQAVKDGKITQEQADKQLTDLKARMDKWDGKLPMFGPKDGMPGRGFGIFGIKPEDLKDLTPEQAKAKILEEATTRNAQAVTDGKMTQEQADKCLADLKAKLEKWDGKTPIRGPKDGQGQMKGHKKPILAPTSAVES